MPKFKNIRLKMKGGKTRTQRVQVLPSGKYRFVKNIGSRSRKLTKTVKKITRRRFSLTRRKRSRGSRKLTIPIAPIAGLLAGLAKPIEHALAGNFDTAFNHLSINYTGVHPVTGRFNPEWLKIGLMPLVMGCLVHKFVGGAPLNLNRVLANAGVPYIRI